MTMSALFLADNPLQTLLLALAVLAALVIWRWPLRRLGAGRALLHNLGLIVIGALLAAALLLAGCGRKTASQTDALRQRYRDMQAAHMEAEITCHLETENRTFTVSCDWTPTGAGTTVTAPEALAGLTASVSGEDLTVSYDGAALSAGSLRDVAPANCLPWLLRAMEEGYLVDAGQETLEGLDCLRLALDTTAPGGKVLCTVWLGGDGAPLYAEFSQDSRVVLTARLLSFTSE